MNYPDGEMRYIWEGRGSRGPSADCLITADEIRLRPKKVFRSLLGYPELVFAPADVRAAEAMFFGRCCFRSDSKLLDGACFRPIGGRQSFLTALNTLGIQVTPVASKEKLVFELRTFWKQMRWGGRLRRRHWKREQHEPVQP